MTREQVWKTMTATLRKDFGRLLDVRGVRRVRRVTHDAWIVTVVLSAPSGDLHVADVNVDDTGAITPVLNADHVIEAVRRDARASVQPTAPDTLTDFGEELASELDDEPALELLATTTEAPLDARARAAIARGDTASLREARELLPHLLADHERRGATLLTMARVEVKLGQTELARGYLEAAAREFADRYDLGSLEDAAALDLELGGPDAFVGSPVHALLEQSRARLTPLSSLFEARSFAHLPGDLRAKLLPHARLRTLAAGEALVNEGEPSQNVFVVKSGLLGVWLERPEGGSWLVRCCFPGWLLGESSVLGAADARCTATLRAERISEVWICPASIIRTLMADDRAFALRIAETKQLHRIDSFFSMHETMGQLDVQVRDEMLQCIQRLETFHRDTLLLRANEIPNVACLVARGSIGLFEDGKPDTPLATIEADSFYGVRDAVHQIAPHVAAIARAGTTVAFFDAKLLQKLCERSPEHVVAVLERLG
ncbi:cyclic nucleotide-binding domain-containing protein [Pendulispora albinea]|uniref:Crp/Fnr family transcriptional regulator n=1 Tax=Pendulispora albinea TaxID=2741071 RepID=A0ABZ2M3H0_9BACT